jgi:Ca-activated chloride channel family protein
MRSLHITLISALAIGLACTSQALRDEEAAGEIELEPITVTSAEQLAPTVPAELMARGKAARDAAYAVRTDLPGRYNPNFNTEAYDQIVENMFLSVAANPLSTFSIDVDRASYSNVRRFIVQGQRPPIDAVRIEELINYFTYDYPDPHGEHPFSITTEVTAAPWNALHQLVRIGIQGQRIDIENLPASNLVFLLDVSGSMQSPDKLPLLKASFRMLVNELRPEDRVAIAVYAGAAGLVLPSTSGAEKEKILDALEALEAGGSTAGGAGIVLAYKVAHENHIDGGNNRVILATDGDFNVGASSDSEMVRLIEAKREQGTFLTVLGFGTGNLKDAKMEKLADHGNGNFAYIDNLMEARKVLVTEMGGTLLTIAKDVKIQVEFNDDTKDAGELGAGHSVTALYEVIPAGVESAFEIRGVDSLRYLAPGTLAPRSDSPELMFVKLRYKQPDGTESRLIEQPVLDGRDEPSTDLRFAAAVAGFGMILRESQYCGSDWTLSDVLSLARASTGEDVEGYRSEFVRLVEAVNSMELLAQATY